jgi:hypothetical protein
MESSLLARALEFLLQQPAYKRGPDWLAKVIKSWSGVILTRPSPN